MRHHANDRPLRRRHLLPALVVLLALGAAACSGGEDASTTQSDTGSDTAGGFDGGGVDDFGDEGAAEAPRDAGDAAGEDSGAGGSIGLPGLENRKVIRNAELDLVVEDTEAAVRDITRLVEAAGGFVASADLVRFGDEEDGGQLRGFLTLRVPSERLSATLDGLEDLAVEVKGKSLGSDDVTGEYADIEAQLTNLRAVEEELRDLLTEVRESSSDANQILTVFERLRVVRDDIERLEGRQQLLDDLVALSTVTVNLEPEEGDRPIVDDDWSPGDVARDALEATVDALRAVVDVLIWLALTLLPLALLLLGPIALVAWIVLRRRRRRRQDRAETTVPVPARSTPAPPPPPGPRAEQAGPHEQPESGPEGEDER